MAWVKQRIEGRLGELVGLLSVVGPVVCSCILAFYLLHPGMVCSAWSAQRVVLAFLAWVKQRIEGRLGELVGLLSVVGPVVCSCILAFYLLHPGMVCSAWSAQRVVLAFLAWVKQRIEGRLPDLRTWKSQQARVAIRLEHREVAILLRTSRPEQHNASTARQTLT